MNQPLPEKQRLTLERKHHARMAAVQAIFSHRILEKPLNGDAAAAKIWQQWEAEQGHGEPEWNVDSMPQKALLESLLVGVAEEYEALEEDVNGTLRDDWKLSRINPVLAAILIAAAYELKSDTQRAAAVIISEYVDIADNFVEGNEVDFINGALNNLAGKYRNTAEAET